MMGMANSFLSIEHTAYAKKNANQLSLSLTSSTHNFGWLWSVVAYHAAYRNAHIFPKK